MSKWHVRRGEYSQLSEAYYWDIYNPDWDWDGSFCVWSEAVAEAARLSRTVEVTLPRKSSVFLYALDSEGRRWARDERGNEICYMPNVQQGNLKDIILDFLSFYYRNERNKHE